MIAKDSPYFRVQPAKWKGVTCELVKSHPLCAKEIVEVVLSTWNDIFESRIGKKPFRIGVDLFPKPQILAFFLHELIPLEFARRYADLWRGEGKASEKDLVYLPDERFSVEIKTSSHKTRIFGNRSYAQTGVDSRKNKSGFYLAVNFEKCTKSMSGPPKILRIRFGWLDASDRRGQRAASGQQANLSPCIESAKLLELFPKCEL